MKKERQTVDKVLEYVKQELPDADLGPGFREGLAAVVDKSMGLQGQLFQYEDVRIPLFDGQRPWTWLSTSGAPPLGSPTMA